MIAIIITIMVLELRVPHGADWASLRPMLPVFLAYVLSFVYLGIYFILARSLVAHHGHESALAVALGSDRKGKVSIAIYGAAVLLAYASTWISCAL